MVWSQCRKSSRSYKDRATERGGGGGGGGGRKRLGMTWHGVRIVPETRCYSSIDIDKLATLSQIGLTDQEKKEMGPQIERIVDWFGQLQSVNVSGVPPAMRGSESRQDDTSWLRSDEVRESTSQDIDGLLGQVPGKRVSSDGFILVPKTEQD